MTIQIKINKLPKSAVEIEGELESSAFESYFDKAVKHLGEDFELDGFRKGKVPTDVMLSNIPEIRILEEMAQLAISEHYPKVIAEQKLDIISQPEISITKLARNNPLNFKIKVAVLPEFTLPDYKSIAKKTLESLTEADKSIEISDAELGQTIMDIRKSRAPKVKVGEIPHEHKEGEDHDHDALVVDEKNLPEWNDEFVQALGPFENIADFTEKLKENLKLEKTNLIREKTRLKIMEAIIEATVIEVPEIIVALETEKILYRMESDIAGMGMNFDDYLKHLNKTKEDLKKEFEKDAEKKAILSLILNQIAKVENLEPNTEDIEKEVAHIMEHYKDADKSRAEAYAHNILTNEKIFQFLETQN